MYFATDNQLSISQGFRAKRVDAPKTYVTDGVSRRLCPKLPHLARGHHGVFYLKLALSTLSDQHLHVCPVGRLIVVITPQLNNPKLRHYQKRFGRNNLSRVYRAFSLVVHTRLPQVLLLVRAPRDHKRRGAPRRVPLFKATQCPETSVKHQPRD